MGKIAQFQMNCPLCMNLTNIYVEESNASTARVNCEHCKTVF